VIETISRDRLIELLESGAQQRVAIIGCGLIGQKRAKALRGCPLVVCCDVIHARAEALANRGYGDEWIRHDLAGHDVAVEAVTEAIAALVPEAERAAALVERLGSTPKTGAQLARKGFGQDALEAALGIDVGD